jgi:AMP deaminase
MMALGVSWGGCADYIYRPQILKLPQSSLAELARNSVIQSGFEMEVKRHWLGEKWYLPGAAGNDINRVSRSSLNKVSRLTSILSKTNVPDIRLIHRHQVLLDELSLIRENNLLQHSDLHPGLLPTADAVAARAMANCS